MGVERLRIQNNNGQVTPLKSGTEPRIASLPLIGSFLFLFLFPPLFQLKQYYSRDYDGITSALNLFEALRVLLPDSGSKADFFGGSTSFSITRT